MKKILLIEDDSNYIWHIKNFLQRKGYHVLVAFTVSQGKELIEKEQILIIGSDLKLSDGSGMELLEYLREKTYKIPFLFFTCYDKKYYEKEALEKGAKICMNKLQFDLVKETLLEYAYKESNGEGATFHKILLVKKNSEITSIIQTELLKKGIYMIMVETIWEAENKLLECQDIELILCDLFLQDGIAMDFFYSMKKLAGIYQNTKEPIFRELPFFISLIIKILYGKLDASGETFADEGKTTLVMMPALGVPSPHIYFKPLAQSLDESFNIVIVEPFGYGLSDVAATDRTVDNINSELNAALDTMGIKQCVLLVHSISGVYGLNFVQNYPEKVKGFIAVDNTVYDEELAEAMEMEKKYMLQGIDEFQKIKNSFSSLEEFQMALKTDPDKYGAALPQVSGYTYTESDREEYIQAYSLSSNDTIRNEVNGMDQSLLSIKNKKFPSALPVLTMISSENVQNVPAWETAHRNQLDLESGNHQLYIVNGGHYIWYTNLTQVVQLIDEWRIENHF